MEENLLFYQGLILQSWFVYLFIMQSWTTRFCYPLTNLKLSLDFFRLFKQIKTLFSFGLIKNRVQDECIQFIFQYFLMLCDNF